MGYTRKIRENSRATALSKKSFSGRPPELFKRLSGDPNQVYKAKHPLFEAIRTGLGTNAASSGVSVRGIVENQAAPSARYEPGNPLADANGYVYAPNVNTVEEMVDMISASRSYQNNVEVMNTAKDMMLATLRLGQ